MAQVRRVPSHLEKVTVRLPRSVIAELRELREHGIVYNRVVRYAVTSVMEEYRAEPEATLERLRRF